MAHRVRLQSLLIVVLALHQSPAQADFCMPPTVQEESPYHYLVSLAEALRYAKSGRDHIDVTALESSADSFDLLLGLKLGKADYECAGSQVSPYASSPNEPIRLSATAVAVVFSRLAELHGEWVSEYKDFLDSIGEGRLKPGTFLEKQAELGASYNKVWKVLIPGVIAGTYAVIEVEPTTGLMSRLVLTPDQRDKILEKLRSTFGEQVTSGIKGGQTSLVAAASALYQVVGNSKYQLREPR